MSSPEASSPRAGDAAAAAAEFCDHCGGRTDSVGRTDSLSRAGTVSRVGTAGHAACAAARVLEPPRYCPHCGRRTVVKVTPHGWSSHCTRHGTTTSAPGG